MPRRRGSGGGITIGFFGTAEMDTDQAIDLFEEYMDANSKADDPIRLWFPLTTNEYSDTLGELIDMAKDNNFPYEVITSPSDKRRRSFTEFMNGAAKSHSVEDPIEFLQRELGEAPGAALLVLWDKEREEEMQEVVAGFLDKNVKVLELTDGLTPLGEEEEKEAKSEAEAEPDEEGHLYTKSELERLTRTELREITEALGIPARRASATMIEDILAAQEEGAEEEEEAEESETTEEGEAEPVVPPAALDSFLVDLQGSLNSFLADLVKVLADNPVRPAQDEPAPEQPTRRRRLSRAGRE